MVNKGAEQRKDGLVAILKEVSDLTILQNEGWYRIPVKSAPKRWPPKWMAFYQPKVFGEEAYQTRFYGFVDEIKRVKRYQLFPNELLSIKSEQEYYQIFLEKLIERSTPIISTRQRRLVFIPTTWHKFEIAVIFNDLFDDSPLEDTLWLEFKKREIDAERQWRVKVSNNCYYLDFAIFCKNGQIDVETDGDTYHLKRSQVMKDNTRDNALQIEKWKVLRFNTYQITDQFEKDCMGIIQNGINSLGGLQADNLVPRIFYNAGNNLSQQLSLFDSAVTRYRIESMEESEFEEED
jgi:very-short-patch-repair endonuclease